MRKNKKTEKETQAKFGHIPEAHGFLTFLKSYENLPSFRPVIETTIPDDYEFVNISHLCWICYLIMTLTKKYI